MALSDIFKPIADTVNKAATALANKSSSQSNAQSYSPTTGVNVYGSGADLQNAMNSYNGKKGINFIDVSKEGFDPSTMKNGIMLGGSGVNTNVTDDVLDKSGIQRLWGQGSKETAHALSKYMKSYGQPNMPTTPTASNFSLNVQSPNYSAFEFKGSMQDYLDQAQGLLKPQYDLSVKQLNQNYDSNIIPGINNDTLSRGLARSSYAGNRVDQANQARQDDLSNLDMQQQQLVNNMAAQNYDKAYDRSYNAWNAENQWNWNKYITDVQNQKDTYNLNNQNLWKQYDANMNMYNAANDNYKFDKQFENQNLWNQKNYDLQDRNSQWENSRWAQEFVEKNKQWQQQFDYQKEQDALANALRSSGGGSGGGGRKSSGGSKGSGSSSSGEDTGTQYKDVINNAIADGDYEKVKAMVYADKQGIINELGQDYWNSLEKQLWDWQAY